MNCLKKNAEDRVNFIKFFKKDCFVIGMRLITKKIKSVFKKFFAL